MKLQRIHFPSQIESSLAWVKSTFLQTAFPEKKRGKKELGS